MNECEKRCDVNGARTVLWCGASTYHKQHDHTYQGRPVHCYGHETLVAKLLKL